MTNKSPLFIGFEGLEPDWQLVRHINPMGVVLFQRNLESLEQVQDLCQRIHRECPGTVIAIDQEGGRVNRLSHLLPEFPAPPAWKDEAGSFQAGKTMGAMLTALEIDMNFAPAVDMDYGEKDNALAGRLFSHEANRVVSLADAYLRGLTSSGCMGCIKHFPGLGTTKQDSHFFLPKFRGDQKSWEQEEGAVYRNMLIGQWASVPVMLAHCVIPFWENQVASSSALAVKAIRDMGSTGLLLTDDLEMKAVSEDQLEAFCQNAFEAGVDALMVCRSLEKAEQLFELAKDVNNDAFDKLMAHKSQCQQVDAMTIGQARDLWSTFIA